MEGGFPGGRASGVSEGKVRTKKRVARVAMEGRIAGIEQESLDPGSDRQGAPPSPSSGSLLLHRLRPPPLPPASSPAGLLLLLFFFFFFFLLLFSFFFF
ncbi:hypothetical protein Taro_042823 [Colocasia esculenta]|uniref:Uncharacterized protein n=1 Tax=Colocasia esculenta TaxID=4460 RepID=A0A843WHW0_COLES|nr:hypothetical protein [Colocasia esculenta]